MRVTTRMVNDAAVKAGVPTNANTLLDYVKGTSGSNNLLGILSNSKNDQSQKVQKSQNGYEKLEKAAGQLLQKAQALTQEGEDSLFAKARQSGDTEEIRKSVDILVKSYNETLDVLRSSSSALDQYYCKMLQETVAGSKGLDAIGISVSKDGKLKVNAEKLKAADIDSLEKALTGADGLAGKVLAAADKITDVAKANAESLSSHYNADGSVSSGSSHLYDYRRYHLKNLYNLKLERWLGG